MARTSHEKELLESEDPLYLLGKDVLLARQSILGKDHSIYGFEMLYRGSNYDVKNTQDGMGATGELLSNLYTCVVERKFNASYPIFINVDEQFIESPSFFPTQSDKIILELLETVPATPSVLSKVKELKRQGFEFALDDYIFEPERSKFLPLVSIVKIDVLACPFAEIQTKINTLKDHSVRLLAEKVENFDMYTQCEKLGFDLFQGYYLESPKLIRGTKISVNKQVTLKLLSELTRPDISVNKVADLIACDPRLAMKIILLVNSSLFSFVRQVSDVQEAVVMLGIDAVKRWAMILLLVSESEQHIEIFRTLLCRAKTLELYASDIDESKPSDYFSLGLFSGIDAVLGVDMDSIIECLPLTDQLKAALSPQTSNMGEMGKVLSSLKLMERNDQSTCSPCGAYSLTSTYWQGLIWADELMDSISE